jgi:catalase (peroxidase I)
MVAALIADGFRNYLRNGENLSPETRLLDGPTC